jgi:hypothetical protein
MKDGRRTGHPQERKEDNFFMTPERLTGLFRPVDLGKVAEGAGFEPARVLTPYAISSRAH